MRKSKARSRRGREYWGPLVAEFEATPCRHEKFAARHKVNVATFRQWLYRLRAAKPRAVRKPAPGFVEVIAAKEVRGCTLAMGNVELRFDSLPTAEYLADLLSRAGH